jgi:hypothetical protein
MLFALALAAQTVPVPMVEHNHFYVTVDRPTFEAIRQSKWLREEFANVSVSTHASGDNQWTGIYVSGLGTYVEIFAEGADFRLGQAGVGLFTQKPGGADDIDFHKSGCSG